MASDRIRTFAVGFDDPASNELPFARMAARAVGAQHHEVVLSADEFFRALPRLIWHEDEPIAFPSSIALNAVSQLACSHVKVVQLVPRNRLERSPWPPLRGLDPGGCSEANPESSIVLASGPPTVSRPKFSGAGSRSEGRILREVCGLSGVLAAGAGGRASPHRGERPLSGADAVLRGGAGLHAGPDESRGSSDIPDRATDEAGSDEHGRFRREPRAADFPDSWATPSTSRTDACVGTTAWWG
jgi:Asparagine synthase